MAKYRRYEMVAQNAGDDLQATFELFCKFLLRKPRDKGPIIHGDAEKPPHGIRLKIRRVVTAPDVEAFFAETPQAVRFILRPWSE